MDPKPAAVDLVLEPADNRRLASLCGQFDQHLRQIERRLGVEINNRGNRFQVIGDSRAARLAGRVLERLYVDADSAAVTPEQVHLHLQQADAEAAEALGVIAEIGVFLMMHRWLPRFGARRLLIASLALTTLRWLLIAGFGDHLPTILGAQLLHAASFGVHHAVAIHLIHQFFVGRNQGRGQALYSSLSFGAGGAVGSLVAGYLWSGVGAEWTYVAAAAVSGMAWAVAWWGLKSVRFG